MRDADRQRQGRGSRGESVRTCDPYRELFERSADAILIIEGETFVDCNQATVEMLRCRSKAEVLRTHPSELSPPLQPDGRDSYEKANEMIAIAFAEGSHRFEWDHRRADGEVFPVEVLLTAVQEQDRRKLHVVWRDITDRKRLEDQLRHAQKMEAIGRLAGGIAHDFNNLLVAILGHSDLLGQELVSRPDLLECVDQIRDAGERAAALVRQLLAFSRKQDLQPQILDLCSVLESMERFLIRLIGENIRLVRQSTAEPVKVRADPGQVEQIIANLVTNARDAMPQGGILSLEVRRVYIDDLTNGATRKLAPGLYALLRVSDTGTGMSEETMRRAFDPFFTTKELGKGTGLGLATVYGIVEQSGGALAIDSTPGLGTTVEIHLPIAEGSRSEPVSRPADLPTAGGSETLLVVEDEEAVSRLLVRVLRASGYRVLLARDGREALAVWQQERGAIDLLLTDVIMPTMGGIELVAELRRAGYRPSVLYASGYSDEALSDLRASGEAIDLLEKPFTAEEVVGRVRLALDRR